MKTNKKLLSLLIGLLLVSIVLTACSTSSSGAAAFPTGKFIKSGTTDYGLAFNKDGTFSVFSGDTTYVSGTYKVEGGVFTETSNDGGCDTNVSFKYSFDGKNLTFNYVGNPEDDTDCSGRHADFNNVTYTLSD
jgi:predicted small secreted protein